MSTRKTSTIASLIGAISIFAAASAGATALNVTYDGGQFSLDGTTTSNSYCGGASNCYLVTYTADFTNFTGGSQNQNYFSAIAFQPPGSTIDYAENFEASTWGGTNIAHLASSTLIDNGLSANGCGSFSAHGQWVCSDFNPWYSTTGKVSFEYYVGLGSGTLDFSGSSMKMLFFSSLDATKTSGLMSCNAEECGSGSSVPEPATLALFAAGLAGLGFALDRRRRKA